MKSSGKGLYTLIALLAVTIPSALTATVTYQNDSILLLSSGSYFYGNDVTLRSGVVTSQALMSWVDQATVLPAGWLTRFFLHTFIAVNMPDTSPPVPVRLQIWRPMGVMQYQLVWDYRLLMANNINSFQGVFVQVVLDKTEQFHVKAGDKLGWTCEDDVCPLCYTEQNSTNTIISQNEVLPNISTSAMVTFEFDTDNGVFGPFSVAAEVTPDLVQIGSQGPAGIPGSAGATGRIGATGATGPAGPQGSSLPGIDGEPGAPGLIGATGSAGPQGQSGPQGQPGIQLVGPTGPQGPAGPPGSSSSTRQKQVKSDPRLNGAIIGIVVPLSVLTVLILILVVCLACRLSAKDKRNNSLNYSRQRDSSYSYGLEDNVAYNQFDKDYSYGPNHKPAHYDDDI